LNTSVLTLVEGGEDKRAKIGSHTTLDALPLDTLQFILPKALRPDVESVDFVLRPTSSSVSFAPAMAVLPCLNSTEGALLALVKLLAQDKNAVQTRAVKGGSGG